MFAYGGLESRLRVKVEVLIESTSYFTFDESSSEVGQSLPNFIFDPNV